MLRPLAYYYNRRQLFLEMEKSFTYTPRPFVAVLMELKDKLKKRELFYYAAPKVYNYIYVAKPKSKYINIHTIPKDIIKTKKYTEDTPIRIRTIKRVNFKNYYVAPFTHLRMKKWDKYTKETSNKGLRATHYTNSDQWGFESHYSVGELELFAKRNGFKKEKGKKYKYGDYAEWIIHNT